MRQYFFKQNTKNIIALFFISLTSCASIPTKPVVYPDPLKAISGKPVASVQDWKNVRRPELKKLFEDNIYGVIPGPMQMTFNVRTAPTSKTKKFKYREVVITFDDWENKPNAPKMRLALFLPTNAKKKVPVFLALNKCGNQEVHDSTEIIIDPKTWRMDICQDEGWSKRGGRADFWPVEYIVSQGYAFATFHESDIEPDTEVTQPNSVRNFLKSSNDPKKNWGTIAIWAWGLSRAVDYLMSDNEIDQTKIFLTGHSRRGKATLLATAMDERVAMVIPHQSGTLGMALSRNNDQESLEKINDKFPHWFSAKAKEYNDREELLPVDQHMLVSLVAPRPLLSSEGIKDHWANYESGVQNLKLADEVYRFMGARGVVGNPVIMPNQKMTASNTGRLAQVRVDTDHTLNKAYWQRFIEFANLHFGNAAR